MGIYNTTIRALISPRKVSSIFPVSGVEVVVGILLNSTHMHRRVDRGPAASEDVECAKFRQFWGQKSEMRRFKDGSIVEAVVWSDTDIGHNCGTVRPGHLISAIAGYIFNRHIPFCERIRMSTDQLADFLPQYSQNLPAVNLPSSNTMCHSTQQLFSRAIESVVVLRRILTSDLKGFPLVIENLRPSSAALRYTSLFPPVSNPLFMTSKSGSFSGERINPVSIVFPIIANLQKSSRWPSDLIATKSLKSALLVKLSSNLEAQFSVPWISYLIANFFCADFIFHSSFMFRYLL